MQAEIEHILSSLGGRVACVVSQASDEPRERLALNSHMVFPAASLAKVPILVTLAQQIAAPDSPYTWQTRLEVPESARVSSDGVLADLSPHLRLTLRDM